MGEGVGDALQLSKEANLYSDPLPGSRSLGRLPPGTLLSSKGQKKGSYVFVTVELENGDVLEGWVSQQAVAVPVDDEEKIPVEPIRVKPKSNRVAVPQDEALLLRRDPSFFYGLQLGLNMGILQTEVTTNYYNGIGMMGGAHAGLFIARNMPLRFELTYKQLKGADEILELDFNFLDFAVIAAYQFNSWEVSGGLQYSMALGVGEVPNGIVLQSVSELSAVGLNIGGGYRLPVGYMVDLVLRVRYEYSFLRAPFTFQNISFLGFLEFRG